MKVYGWINVVFGVISFLASIFLVPAVLFMYSLDWIMWEEMSFFGRIQNAILRYGIIKMLTHPAICFFLAIWIVIVGISILKMKKKTSINNMGVCSVIFGAVAVIYVLLMFIIEIINVWDWFFPISSIEDIVLAVQAKPSSALRFVPYFPSMLLGLWTLILGIVLLIKSKKKK